MLLVDESWEAFGNPFGTLQQSFQETNREQ